MPDSYVTLNLFYFRKVVYKKYVIVMEISDHLRLENDMILKPYISIHFECAI